MRTIIQTKSIDGKNELTVTIGNTVWGDNIVITKTALTGGLIGLTWEPENEECMASIEFALDKPTARALARSLSALADDLGSK